MNKIKVRFEKLPMGLGAVDLQWTIGIDNVLASLFSVLRSWTLCRSRMLMDDRGEELVGAKLAW